VGNNSGFGWVDMNALIKKMESILFKDVILNAARTVLKRLYGKG